MRKKIETALFQRPMVGNKKRKLRLIRKHTSNVSASVAKSCLSSIKHRVGISDRSAVEELLQFFVGRRTLKTKKNEEDSGNVSSKLCDMGGSCLNDVSVRFCDSDFA